MGNDTPYKIKSKGKVWLQMHGVTIKGLIDVGIVQNMKKNMILLGVLLGKSLYIIFAHSGLKSHFSSDERYLEEEFVLSIGYHSY